MAMSNLEIGQEIRQKLDFYLIAIALAVLGLSVQTANFGNYVGADCAELLAWLALLASALFGLARIDGTPKLLGHVVGHDVVTESAIGIEVDYSDYARIFNRLNGGNFALESLECLTRTAAAFTFIA